MIKLTNQQKTELIDQLISEGHLGNSLRELALAIITGSKCRDLGLQSIQAGISQLIDELLIYYGHNYTDDERVKLKFIAATDFYQYHYNLTIEELKLGIRMASRKKFGEVKHFNKFSLDFLSQLLSKYENSEERKKILHHYNNALNERLASPHIGISEDEKRELSYSMLIKGFEKFKEEGPDNLIIPAHHYDYLLNLGCSPPDYTLFSKQAQDNIRRAQTRKRLTMRVNETTNEAAIGSLVSECKRLALLALYGELKRQNKTIIDYMTPQFNSISNAV